MREPEAAPAPPGVDGHGLRIGVVRARWNGEIVERLAQGAHRALADLRVLPADVVEVEVPGSFELPMGASILARSGRVDALVCLGCVVRGETSHYDLVAAGAAEGVSSVQLATGVPVGFGVLAVEDRDQALARSQDRGGHNVGEQAVHAAVEMALLARAHSSRAREPRAPG